MTLIGIDMNGTRIRMVQGPAADFPLLVPLEPYTHELPMILSLANGKPEVGSAGARLCRKQPHLACHGFLSQVGAPANGKNRPARWRAGHHDLDAIAAMEHVWQRLEPACRKSAGVVVGLSGYLSNAQANIVRHLGHKLRLPILGSLPLPLAAALAGYAEQCWTDSVLVLDVDDHALTIAEVRAVGGHAHVLEVKHLPHLGLRVWRERLINALADLCVLQSRRDPRASPHAEQGLHEQLDALLESCQKGRMMQVSVQTATWFQNLLLRPEQVVSICAGLTRQFLKEVETLWARLGQEEKNLSLPALAGSHEHNRTAVLATHMVGRLPGLIPALHDFVERQRESFMPLMSEDFGENLIGHGPADSTKVIVLGPDLPARAIHALGPYFKSGDAAAAHLELTAPLPRPTDVELGPPRLTYQGHDFLLSERNFYLGCHDTQLLVDEANQNGSEARRCEVVFDQRTYILFNRSREVTLVNDYPVAGSVALHPGDWIRLGYDGPLVRFLGQAGNSRAS